MVEGGVLERDGGRIRLDQRRLDARALEVPPRVLELLRLDVDAGEAQTGELLPEHGEHGPDAAAQLEEARPGLERRPVDDQPLAPVLRLLDQPLLLARPVSVNVLRHLVKMIA